MRERKRGRGRERERERVIGIINCFGASFGSFHGSSVREWFNMIIS